MKWAKIVRVWFTLREPLAVIVLVGSISVCESMRPAVLLEST